MTETLDQKRLLKAILDNLNEDTLRLMYADEIQTNGDEALAELIRVQCEIANQLRDTNPQFHHCLDMILDPGDTEEQDWKHHVQGLQKRESALLAAHAARWLRVECPKCLNLQEAVVLWARTFIGAKK
jgi:uncharacterized protein (TIGR02996 family)